jgi:hypothetical protein
MLRRWRLNGSQAVYVALSAILLISYGVYVALSDSRSETWQRGVCTACLLMVALLAVRRLTTGNLGSVNVWIVGCVLYGALVLVGTLTHAAALSQLPRLAKVNVAGVSAAAWFRQNTKFCLYYVCFPALCALQYALLRNLGPRAVTRVLCVCLSASFLCVAASQTVPQIVKPEWVVNAVRFRGLLSTPNAYALAIYLLLPWIVSSMLNRGGKGEKVLYVCCFALALKGMLDSGSRTGLAMMLAFVAVAPVVAAVPPTPLRRRARGALLTVPPLLVVGLAALVIVVARPGGSGGSGVVASRVGDIWDRVQEGGVRGIFFLREVRGLHALVAWLMVLRAPLAGWGPGGFYRQFPNVLFLATGRVKATTDSALNHYLMIGGDLGLPALAVNLFLLLLPLWIGYRILRSEIDNEERLLIRLLILGNLVFMTGINLMPPAYSQEVVWLWTVQLAYLAVVARRNGLLPTMRGRTWRTIFVASSVAFAAGVLAGSAAVAWGSMGYSAARHADWWPWRYGRNCYGIERWSNGVGCWCANDAVLQIPFFGRPPEALHVPMKVRHPDVHENPVIVEYGGLSGTTQKIAFRSKAWKTVVIPVTEEYLYSPTASRERRRWQLPWIPPTAKSIAPRDVWYVVLAINVSRTWIPRQWAQGGDRRELGVMVRVPTGRFERGCFHADPVSEGFVRWCSTDAVVQVPIRGTPPDSLQLGLGAFHPDIRENNVTIRYGGVSGPTDSVIVKEKSWTEVTIPLTDDYLYSPANIGDPQWRHLLSAGQPGDLETDGEREGAAYLVLSLQSSRGWTPREWIPEGDAPEVGVALRLRDFGSRAGSAETPRAVEGGDP